MKFYHILKSAHSGWRYLVLILLVVAIVTAIAGWLGKKPYTEGNRKLNVFTLIFVHIQLTGTLLSVVCGLSCPCTASEISCSAAGGSVLPLSDNPARLSAISCRWFTSDNIAISWSCQDNVTMKSSFNTNLSQSP